MKHVHHALLALLFLTTLAFPAHASLASLPEVYQKTYALRAELKKGMDGQVIDYQRLRLDYFALYGAYIDEASGATIFGNVNSKDDYQRYLKRGGIDAVSTYVDLGTHDYLVRQLQQHGNTELAFKHMRVRQGLLDAIRNSATGTSISQAIPLISYRELNDFISLSGLEWKDSEDLKHGGSTIKKVVLQDKQGRSQTLFFLLPTRYRDLTKENIPPVMQFVAQYLQNTKTAKYGGGEVDFQLLRRDARLLFGKQLENQVHELLLTKLQSKDNRNAIRLTEHLITANFTSAFLHAIAHEVATAMDNEAHADLHMAVAQNLFRSISQNSDGRSKDKPIVIFDGQDLSEFLIYNKFEVASEKELKDPQGEPIRPFLFETVVKHKETGVSETYFFNLELLFGDYPPMLPVSEPTVPRLIVDLNRETAMTTTRKALEYRFDQKARLGEVHQFTFSADKREATLQFHASGIVPMIKMPESRPPCAGTGVASFSKDHNDFWTLTRLNLRDVRDGAGRQCYTPFGLSEDLVNVGVE